MSSVNSLSSVLGRVLLSVIFISAGFSKLGSGYDGTQAYMEMMSVSGALLPLVIATEVLGGFAVLLGFQTKVAAFLLAGFTLLAAIFFHSNFSDQMQSIMFMKNLAIAGGLITLFANGAGRFSLDRLRS